MPGRKGLLAPQNNFLDTIATRFDGTRELPLFSCYVVALILRVSETHSYSSRSPHFVGPL